MHSLLVVGMIWAALGGHPRGDLVRKELDAFQGEWKVEWIELGGKRIEWRKSILAFRGKQRLTRQDEEIKYKDGGTLEIDPRCSPKTIDFINGDDRKEGIYKIQGDTMLWCVYEGDGKNRPLAFRTEPGSRTILIKLSRIKMK
jgi:uncharacterized protein (TIGR03067 family)